MDVIDSGLPALDRALTPVINESLAPEMGDSVDPLQLLTAASGWVWLLGCLVMLGYGAISFLRLKLRLREAVLAGPGVREGAMVDSPCPGNFPPGDLPASGPFGERAGKWCFPMSGPI
ncbi:MAG: hypothetical protein V8T45_00125 [Oscillospiraceae bacterium]